MPHLLLIAWPARHISVPTMTLVVSNYHVAHLPRLLSLKQKLSMVFYLPKDALIFLEGQKPWADRDMELETTKVHLGTLM